MQSLKELYKIGRGPSSSHTMGPERAIKILRARYPKGNAYKVTLYGSLAMTGKGHGTDRVIKKTASPASCEVVFDTQTPCTVHPNTMDVEIYHDGELLVNQRVYSVGGGSVAFEGVPEDSQQPPREVYALHSFTDIARYCSSHEKIEQDLLKQIDKKYYYDVNHLFVWHGRNICTARNPKCNKCPISSYCKSNQLS